MYVTDGNDMTFTVQVELNKNTSNQPIYSIDFFLYLETFNRKTTSDWLNHMIKPIRSCGTFEFTNLGEKDKECS